MLSAPSVPECPKSVKWIHTALVIKCVPMVTENLVHSLNTLFSDIGHTWPATSFIHFTFMEPDTFLWVLLVGVMHKV